MRKRPSTGCNNQHHASLSQYIEAVRKQLVSAAMLVRGLFPKLMAIIWAYRTNEMASEKPIPRKAVGWQCREWDVTLSCRYTVIYRYENIAMGHVYMTLKL